MRVPVHECPLDGSRRRRRLTPQECWVEIEQGADERAAILLKTRVLDEAGLKRHMGVAEQPRLTLQTAGERRHIPALKRSSELLHDEHLPQPELRDLRKP